MNWTRGDLAGFVYGMPGPDITYLMILEVRGDVADTFDTTFSMEVKDVALARLWRPSERELASTIGFSTADRKGSFSIQQLWDEALQKYGIAPPSTTRVREGKE